MSPDDRLRAEIARHPYPLLFATVSGAHLYGFPSPDSDYDLRGCHLLPAHEVVGLDTGPETVESSTFDHGLEVDLVTHDARKFFTLLLRKNGYVLEQLTSPIVVSSGPEHDELKSFVPFLVTRHHSHHYLGFAETQWRLFLKETPPRVKPLLYVYRVLLTGIHLIRSGEVEANLVRLNETFQFTYLSELIDRKRSGEDSSLEAVDIEFHRGEFDRLRDELRESSRTSRLPETPTARPMLNNLLVHARLKST